MRSKEHLSEFQTALAAPDSRYPAVPYQRRRFAAASTAAEADVQVHEAGDTSNVSNASQVMQCCSHSTC